MCDEAHKLSATFCGGEVKYTKRYRLAQLLSQLTRHFLLMTATPHNGTEEDAAYLPSSIAILDAGKPSSSPSSSIRVLPISKNFA